MITRSIAILILYSFTLHSMQSGETAKLIHANKKYANPAYFEKLDIRVGKVINVKDYSKSPNHHSYVVKIDLGTEIGIKQSVLCLELKEAYTSDQLLNKLVMCIVNFPPRQMVNHIISEVVTLGVPGDNANAILITPDRAVALGSKLY